jgi:hypothetical protein
VVASDDNDSCGVIFEALEDSLRMSGGLVFSATLAAAEGFPLRRLEAREVVEREGEVMAEGLRLDGRLLELSSPDWLSTDLMLSGIS